MLLPHEPTAADRLKNVCVVTATAAAMKGFATNLISCYTSHSVVTYYYCYHC